MKNTTWAALAVAAVLSLAVVATVVAGQDDIRRFRRMHSM
jgi:hypothetical protein